MIFPTVTGENLEGQKLTFPADFAGEKNIVFIPFERWHQNDVDTWVPLVAQLMQEQSTLRYYELPTLAPGNPLSRWFINSGMRSGIPDKGTRRVTVTLYIEKQLFCASLQIPDETKIHVFVVSRAGEVLWHTDGPLTEEKGRELRRMVK